MNVLDSVGTPAQHDIVVQHVRHYVIHQWGVASLDNWKHDAHLAAYGPLPDFLAHLGIETPNGLCHHTILPPGKQVAPHEHPWPAFIFYPAAHKSPLVVKVSHGTDACEMISTTPGRLVYVPTGCKHWVLRNMTDHHRIALAGEITNDWRLT